MASPDYLARRGVPQHPSELVAHDCLLYLGGQRGQWTFARQATGRRRSDEEKVGVNLSPKLRANNSEVLREALLAGLGIGLLPDFSLPSEHGLAGRPQLVPVLADWQVQGFFGDRIYALRPWSPQVPAAVQALVAFLRESFSAGL